MFSLLLCMCMCVCTQIFERQTLFSLPHATEAKLFSLLLCVCVCVCVWTWLFETLFLLPHATEAKTAIVVVVVVCVYGQIYLRGRLCFISPRHRGSDCFLCCRCCCRCLLFCPRATPLLVVPTFGIVIQLSCDLSLLSCDLPDRPFPTLVLWAV